MNLRVPLTAGNYVTSSETVRFSKKHLRPEDQQDALFFLIYFNNHPPHVSNILIIHHQEVLLLCILMVLLKQILHITMHGPQNIEFLKQDPVACSWMLKTLLICTFVRLMLMFILRELTVEQMLQ